AEDGIRYRNVTGVQTCALPISQGAHIPAHKVHGFLYGDGIHLAEKGMNQIQSLQLKTAAFLHVPLQICLHYVMSLSGRYVGQYKIGRASCRGSVLILVDDARS